MHPSSHNMLHWNLQILSALKTFWEWEHHFPDVLQLKQSQTQGILGVFKSLYHQVPMDWGRLSFFQFSIWHQGQWGYNVIHTGSWQLLVHLLHVVHHKDKLPLHQLACSVLRGTWLIQDLPPPIASSASSAASSSPHRMQPAVSHHCHGSIYLSIHKQCFRTVKWAGARDKRRELTLSCEAELEPPEWFSTSSVIKHLRHHVP